MRKYSLKIKEQHAPIKQCVCGMKFLEIQAEIDIGYVRECCPWCVPYQHNGVTPKLTRNFIPFVYLNDKNIDF